MIIKDVNICTVYFRDKKYTHEEIMDAVDELSDYIILHSENNSPFVHLIAINHIKTVVAYLAILKAGKICVISESRITDIEKEMRQRDTVPVCTITPESSTLVFDYKKEIVFNRELFESETKTDLDDVVTMFYTAAEDGIPKAAMLTEDNILANVEVSNSVGIIYPDSRVIALLPFSHIYGLINGFLHPALSGIPFMISEVPDLKSARNVFEAVRDNRITIIHTVPLLYFYYTRMPDIKELLKHADFFFSGGVALSKAVFDAFYRKTGKYIYEGYGLTEGTGTCSTHRNGIEVKCGSVGIPNKFCKIKIVDDNGNAVPPGVKGEILLKGRNIMKGYYNCEEETRRVLKDGWLRTGDLGKTDADGYIYCEGLKKNMYNVAGSNVYPEELKLLMEKSRMTESVEISVRKNELLGDSIVASVKLKNENKGSQNAFKDWCRSNISYYKLPRIWIFK